MSDLIERGDAIKALYKYNFVTKEVIEREIRLIPSVDRPKGEWLERNSGFLWWIRCSACDYRIFHGDKTNFCPNCGCRMKGADDE